jgi:TonB-linked SusC/RagA family outer membrane protein
VLTALFAVASPAQAQTGTVQGQVTAASTGRAIEGARVSVVGTSIGTVTDADGMYVLLNVPPGSRQLQISAIGFSMGTLALDVTTGTTTANAEVTASVLRLDEVVVTGTAGQARRREVGNSIAQIDVSRIAAPPQNVENLLQGRAAGVNITSGAGMAGSGSQIRLRGAVSVSQTNQPLIYIDGVRIENQGYLKNVPPVGYNGRSGNVSASPLNDINPNDIERIEVIKGAAASTLYGTDASAGVIQIFTKRGTQGRARWDLQIDQGMTVMRPFGTDNNPYLNMKPCNEGVTCSDIWSQNSAVGTCDEENPNVHCAWVRQGYRQKYSGSVRGGLGAFGYFVSGGLEDYDGVLLQDNEKRLSTRGNFNFDLFDQVRIDWNTSYSNTRIQNTAAGNNAHGITLNVFRAERNYVQSLEPDLLAPLLNQEITTEIDRLITGGTVTYTPFPSFTNKFTIGYDLANQENRNLRPFGFVSAPGGILSDQQVKFQTLTADYAGSINFGLTDDIRSTFSFGGQSVARELISTVAYGEDFPGPGVPTVSNASLYVANESRERTVTAGFFLQNLFSIKDRYFLTGGIRFDGNSAFGSSLGLEAYPKAQGSWVISDESFWPQDLISEMKLRAAVGIAGRSPGAFDAVRTWNPTPHNFEPSFLPQNVGNDSIGPERTREIELGMDAGFFSNRVSAEFTWYNQRTSDALFLVRNIPSLGFGGSQLANVGVIKNSGIELSLNAIVFDAPDWGLDLGFNIYTNNSQVLDLGDAVPFAVGGGGWVEEGHPVMAARGIKLSDPNALEDPVECADDGSNAGACNFTRFQIFGPQQPTKIFTGNVMVRLPKGVRVSARGEFQGGHYIYDGPTGNALSRSVRWPTCEAAYQLIDAGQNDQLNLRQRMECIPSNHEFDLHWYKADFFKLRDLTLQIPMDWAIPSTNSAVLSLSAQNYVRWRNSDLRVFDSEMFGNGGTTRSGVDDQVAAITEHVPSPAVLTASLRVSF